MKLIYMNRVIFAAIRPALIAIVMQNNETYCVQYLHVVVHNIIQCKFAIKSFSRAGRKMTYVYQLYVCSDITICCK